MHHSSLIVQVIIQKNSKLVTSLNTLGKTLYVYLVRIACYDLPPVCKAFDNISLHLIRTESDVPGARGKVAINVLGVTSADSLLLLELLLELREEIRSKEIEEKGIKSKSELDL